jgi:hypothetical protein
LVAFEMTPELTAGDSAEPGGELCTAFRVVALGVAEEGEEDLLGDLFCDRGVAVQAKGVTVDERRVALIESRNRVGGSLPGGEEELVVRVLLRAGMEPEEHV